MHTILIRKESRRGCDIDKHDKLRIITIIKSFPFQIIVIVTVSELFSGKLYAYCICALKYQYLWASSPEFKYWINMPIVNSLW